MSLVSYLKQQVIKREDPTIGRTLPKSTEIDRQILAQELMNRGMTEHNGRATRDLTYQEMQKLKEH